MIISALETNQGAVKGLQPPKSGAPTLFVDLEGKGGQLRAGGPSPTPMRAQALGRSVITERPTP